MRYLPLLFILLAGCEANSSSRAVKGKGTSADSTNAGAEVVTKIAGHVWWKKKPGEKQVRAICEKVTKMKSGELLRIEGNGNFQVADEEQADRYATSPKDFAQDCLWFYLERNRGRRYTTNEAAQELLRLLGKADYEPKHPTLGRKPEEVVREHLKKIYGKNGKGFEDRYGDPKEVMSHKSKHKVVIIQVQHRKAGSDKDFTDQVFILDGTKVSVVKFEDWERQKTKFGIEENP